MVIEHLLDPFAVVSTIARKLKPGGELLVSTVVRDSLDGWIFGVHGVSYDFPRHMVFFRKRDLDALLATDFNVVRSAHDETPIDFWRPARRRHHAIDRWILRFFRLPGSSLLVVLLARLGLTGRVAFRCRRKVAVP